MLPVMFAARKLDGEDPDTIFYLRIAYGVVQGVIILLVLYTYIQATSAAAKGKSTTIYVPPAPSPFADPNAKKKYQKVEYESYVINQARSLLGSTLFGICLTAGLHYYRGMVMGLAMQAVMAPFNVAENHLVKALVMGKGIAPENRVFEEKVEGELTEEDEIVDAQGNALGTGNAAGDASRSITAADAKGDTDKPFEEVLLDTWDDGAKADLGGLMDRITKENCNFKTKESGWTPLMILSGLGGVKGSGSAIRQVMELGGNPAMVDGEGWNALHWAAFHGSVEGAKALKEQSSLLTVKDIKDGKTPLMHAKAEGNDEVAKILQEMEDSVAAGEKGTDKDDGLRKRK